MTAPLFSDPAGRTRPLQAPAAAPPAVGLFREPPAGEEPGDEEIAAVLTAAAAGRRSGPQPRVRK